MILNMNAGTRTKLNEILLSMILGITTINGMDPGESLILHKVVTTDLRYFIYKCIFQSLSHSGKNITDLAFVFGTVPLC